MTDYKTFLRHGALLTAVGLLMRAISLLFQSFLSRAVGAEGLGLFTLISSVYGFAVTFASAGIELTVTRLVAGHHGKNEPEAVAKTLRAAVGYALCFSLSATAVLLFGAPFFAARFLSDARATASLRLLSLSLAPIALTAVISGYFLATRAVRIIAALRVLRQICQIFVSVFALSAGAGDAAGACLALSFSATFGEWMIFLLSLPFFLADRRHRKTAARPPKRMKSRVFATAFPLALSAYIRSALLTLEHVLIPRRLVDRGESRETALSDYGKLHGMALPTLLFPMATLTSFSGLLVPEFAEGLAAHDDNRLSRIAGRALETTLSYAIAVACFLFLFSEEIGYVVFRSYDTGRYLAVLAPVVPIMYLDHVTDSMLKGIGEQVYSMWVNISDALLSVLLVWLLVPVFGIVGYAVVILAMELYNFLLSILRLKKKIRIRVRLLSAGVFPLFCATAVSLLARRLFLFAGAGSSPLLLISKILFSALLFAGLQVAVSAFFRDFGQKREKILTKNK